MEDKRKKYLVFNRVGSSLRKKWGIVSSQKLDTIFTKGFQRKKFVQFEAFQERILDNLKEEGK